MKPFIFMIKDKNNNRQKKILQQLEEALLKFGQLPDDKKDEQAYSALVEIFSDAVYNHVAVTVPVNIDSNLFPAEKLKKGNIINVNFAETVTMNDITTFSDAEHEGLIYNIFTSEDMAFEADIDHDCWITISLVRLLNKMQQSQYINCLKINAHNNNFELPKPLEEALLDCLVNQNPDMYFSFDYFRNIKVRTRALVKPQQNENHLMETNFKADKIFTCNNPLYQGNNEDCTKLYNCYWQLLQNAHDAQIKSISIPDLGIIGSYPEDKAQKIFFQAAMDWYAITPFPQLKIMLLLPDQETAEKYNAIFEDYPPSSPQSISPIIDNKKFYNALADATKIYEPENEHDLLLLEALSTVSILNEMGLGSDYFIAALLQQAVARHYIDIKDVQTKYGTTVARLANSLHYNLHQPWYVEHKQLIHNLANTDEISIQLLALARELAELRSLYLIYKADPIHFRDDLSTPYTTYKHYHENLLQVFSNGYSFIPMTEKVYAEAIDLYKRIFLLQD